jgi:hypothetical protein
MTTVFLLVLGYAAATAAFVRWAKHHAPEGYEDEKRGFVFNTAAPAEGSADEEAAREPVESASGAPARPLGTRLSGSLGAG